MNDGGAAALPLGAVRVGEGGAITGVNTWFADWIGSPADEFVGHTISEYLIHPDEDLLPAIGPGPWMMVNARKRSRAAMVTRVHEQGEDVFLVADASERWRALVELRQQYSLAERTRTRLQLVMDSAVAFATATTEMRLAEILADSTARAYRAEQSTVLLHEPDGTSIVAAGEDPFGGRLEPDALIDLVSAPRRTLKVTSPARAERLAPGLGAAMEAAGVHAFIAAPLHHEEIDFGAFVSWFHHDRTFDEEASPLAEALAGQAAQALATLRLQARLAHAATHDEVTGLPNRRHLEAAMSQFMGTTGCAALFIDLDGFKGVNDRLGHQAGDRMLRDAGRRLLTAVRADDIVARYGGDEFVVACEVPDPTVAMEIAERILEVLRGDPAHPLTEQPLKASIGVALAPPGSKLLSEQLIRRADLAMYRAKTAGGDRIVLADA